MRSDDVAAEFIESRPLARSKAKSEDLQRYQDCLQDCSGHAICNQFIESLRHAAAPTRLLYIEHDSCLRLYTVPQRERPPYAALSYRWGLTQQQEQAKTIITNVLDRHIKIDPSQLPQTIRDAIKVARFLKLSYLWVDALCIVQNDLSDLGTEIAKMASIYRGATITIAAASAVSSTDGFLGDRDLASAYGEIFELPYRYRRGDHEARGSVLLSARSICDTYTEPIDERGWTMQEDMLSLRLLRFGSAQTTWRCPSVHKTIDGGGCPSPINQDMSFAVNNPYCVGETQSAITDSGRMGYSNVWEAWQQSISRYTRRELGNPGDRLPGCAALAENFADIRSFESSDYLAGLWKGDIQAQLLWYRSPGSKSKRSSGPTWSWASVTGSVEFFPRYLLEDDFIVQAQAKLDDSKMLYKRQSHSYAKAEPACLWLNGALRQVQYDACHIRQGIEYREVLPLKIHWDSSTVHHPQTMWCFELVGSYLSLGLVLTMVSGTKFERIGLFEGHDPFVKQWFDGVKRQTIAIC